MKKLLILLLLLPGLANAAVTIIESSFVRETGQFRTPTNPSFGSLNITGNLNAVSISADARFMTVGDSLLGGTEIGELANEDAFFSHFTFTNLSIGGQNSWQVRTNLQANTNWLFQSNRVSGFTTRSDALRYGLIIAGVNDIAGGSNVAAIWFNLSNCFAMITNVGAVPIMCTLWHSVDYGPMYQLSGLIRSNVANFKGILLDLQSAFQPSTNYLTSDGLHPNYPGFVQIRAAIAEAVKNDRRLIATVPRGTNAVGMNSPKELVIESNSRTNLSLATDGSVTTRGKVDIHPAVGAAVGSDYLTIYGTNGTSLFRFGEHPGSSATAMSWFGNPAPTANNWTFFGDGTSFNINVVTTLAFLLNAGSYLWFMDGSNFRPGAHATYDIGTSAAAVKNLYLNGGTYYQSNGTAVATIKAGITNGGSWVGMLSNAVQVVAMSNNVTSFKILYP